MKFTFGSLIAQTSKLPDSADIQEEALNIYQLISEKGGVVMYPLAALSFLTVILIFFYFITIRRNSVVSNRFMSTAEALIRKRDYLGLVAQCHRENKCISRVAEKALDFMTHNDGVPFKEVREVAEAEGSRQAGILTQRISYLSDIGGIAPMIGLLGTVIGMIKSFHQISAGNFEGVKQMELAGGVSEALITTASGLVIGILALIFYSIFRGRVQKYIAELEAAATHLMALLAAQYNESGGKTPKAAMADEIEFDAPSNDDGFADFAQFDQQGKGQRSNRSAND
ncbi:MotA/TolQ/ExbB proton channel family protein [Rubritalea marina]|uniref:MotA/TolQ/ExbB proton channel family protein n=1 Tax=Rubritalea marina TaxID=361055 RepID=UPI00037FC867|nr:MotA/TolQ/ExbB proton channel family protein [Rubritalea marina]